MTSQAFLHLVLSSRLHQFKRCNMSQHLMCFAVCWCWAWQPFVGSFRIVWFLLYSRSPRQNKHMQVMVWLDWLID